MMFRYWPFLIVIALVWRPLPLGADQLASAESISTSVSYRDDVQPILSQHCFRCHGPDAEARESGLRLDQREGAIAEADSGDTAVVPGDPTASQLWLRINHTDDDLRMPPPDGGTPLTDAQRRILRQWIQAGADYQQHWSFAPPQPSRLPLPKAGAETVFLINEIDARVVARLNAKSLTQQPVADRYTLIRRVSLDLTGLPPTIEQVDAFVSATEPDAYEQLVDRLLASPAFGERWARGWLDMARYADSAGYAQDPPRTIWRYRDWVIDALNQGMTYDQFTIDQLAGDLAENPTDDQLIATAFHRNTMTNSEGGTDDEEFRSAAVVDRVNTTMQVWMGLTMACAQCHTHKYDPITHEEYFSFYAVFNNTADADRGDESPLLTEWTAEQAAKRAKLQSELKTAERQLAQHTAVDSGDAESDAPASEPSESATAELKTQLETLKKQLGAIKGTTTPVFRELEPQKRRETFIHLRGSFLNQGKQVSAAVPAAFANGADEGEMDRADVARWLVSPSNPLTARVAANRIWEQLFGIGIVETSEDFGTQGERPSHPQLLDDLAVDLIDSGWDTKRLIRKIVLSHTYRQASVMTPESSERDPRNRLLSHSPSYRWPAEMLRDQALAIGGLLSHKMKGPSVRPPRPKLGLRAAFGASTDWKTSDGEDRYRRGLYTRLATDNAVSFDGDP